MTYKSRVSSGGVVLAALLAILPVTWARAVVSVGHEVVDALTRAPTVTVVVMLVSADAEASRDAADDARPPTSAEKILAAQQRRARIAQQADAVLSVLPAGSYRVRRRFDNVAALALEISPSALAALRNVPGVLRIDTDVGGSAQLLQAIPLAHVSEVRALGFTGLHIKTAVIDSGAQLDHVDLADSIVAQQCFCSSATAGVGCCPNGTPTQSGAGSAADADGHGTNVTGIITGNGSVAPRGAAPDASVVEVRVLDAQASFYSTSDIVAALDWIATNHPDTRVINMSVGTNQLFAGACDTTYSWTMALKAAVNAVAANGTIMTASSGNQASGTSISAPACISGVIAVGAVWDATLPNQTFLGCTDNAIVADKPTCFSNSNALVKLYAPGAYTTSTGLNTDPYTSNGQSTYGGTSQAAPLVAACIADLFQVKAGLNLTLLSSALATSSTHVTDPKSGLTFPRLDCLQAMIVVDRIFAGRFELP